MQTFIIRMSACLLPLLCWAVSSVVHAQTPEASFTPESAKVFFTQSPDLKKSAADYQQRALTAYEAKDLKKAAVGLYAGDYFDLLSRFGEPLPNDLRAFLLSDPDLLAEFLAILSPKDDLPRVLAILAELWKSAPENFRKFPRLAIAIAIVFDTPPPAGWPHHQVGEKILPRVFPEPSAAFAAWIALRERGRLLISPEKLSVEESKYLVSSLATDEDRQWVLQNVPTNLSNIEKLYSSIRYATARLYAEQYDWPGKDYRLKTIKERGGICTDQAYYTAEVAKSRGVPAFIFTGAGAGGFHAWAAYMQKPGSWSFDVGRYAEARFVKGRTIDPQTWEPAYDHQLQAMRERFRNGEKYRANELHTLFARRYLELDNWPAAQSAARAAIALDDRNLESWNILLDAMEKGGQSAETVAAAQEEAMKSFFKYPDIDAEFRRALIERHRAAGRPEIAQRLSTSIILKTKPSRPDIAMDFARQELEQNIREGSAQNLYANYKRLLEVFKNDGAMAFDGIIVPILNALIEAKRFEQTEEIFKITRLILKPERDKTLFANLNILEARVRQIRSGGGTIKD